MQYYKATVICVFNLCKLSFALYFLITGIDASEDIEKSVIKNVINLYQVV